MAARIAVPLHDSDNRFRAQGLRVEYRGESPSLHLTFRDLVVREEDVTTVAEALGECSPDDLLVAVMRHEAGWAMRAEALESRTHAMLARKIADALDAMAGTEAKVRDGPIDQVIGPFWRFRTVGRDGLELAFGAALYGRSGASAAENLLDAGMGRAVTWDGLLRLARLFDGCPESEAVGCRSLRSSTERLSRMPWEQAMGLSLWLPADLSEMERYAVLAKVFWALTYHGFTTDERERRQRAGAAPAEPRERRCCDPWPADPVRAVLDHNCWVDALEMWRALFGALSPGETRL